MERLEEIRPRLDAAVVDLDLPDGRSRDLFLRIREKFPEARRLILSGGALDRSLLGWADEQKIPFLLKPFRLHDLSRTIHDLANRQRLRNNDTS